MKIYFQQKGGIAGRTKDLTLDTRDLSSDESKHLQSLIDGSRFFELTDSSYYSNLQDSDDITSSSNTSTPSYRSGAADYFKYKITIENDKGQNHTIHTSDITKPQQLSPLLNYLRKKLAQKK